MFNPKPLKTMDFTVSTNDETLSFKIQLEGQTFLIYPKTEALFEYLLYSTKSDWKNYINRRPINMQIYKL